MTQELGLLPPAWETQMGFWLLVLAWPLVSEPAAGSFLFLPASLFLPLPLLFK